MMTHSDLRRTALNMLAHPDTWQMVVPSEDPSLEAAALATVLVNTVPAALVQYGGVVIVEHGGSFDVRICALETVRPALVRFIFQPGNSAGGSKGEHDQGKTPSD